MKKNFLLIVAAFLFMSCGRQIAEGKYSVMGYTLTNEAVEADVKITTKPTFEFLNNEMKVEGDFDFNCFADDVYKYKYRENILQLKGETEQREMYISTSENYIELVIDDSEYIQKISLVKIIN